MKPEVGPVCCGLMHSGRWRSSGLYHTHVRPSLAYRQNLLSSLKTTEHLSTLQSTLSWHQSSLAWRCHDVSGNLARGTRDLSHPASRQFPMVLGDTVGATCARISSRNAATAARNNVSTLTCVCTTLPSRTWSTRVGMFYRHCWKQQHAPIRSAQHVQQSVDISIQRPAGLQCDPIQMAELRQQVQDAWHNLSQDDIRHLYDSLHARIHARVAARWSYTVYWCDCLGTPYCF